MWKNYKESLKRDKGIRLGDKLFNYSEIAQRQKALETMIFQEKHKIMNVLSALTQHRGCSAANTSKMQANSLSFSGASNTQLLSSTMSLKFNESELEVFPKDEHQGILDKSIGLHKKIEQPQVQISFKLFEQVVEVIEGYTARLKEIEQMVEEVGQKIVQCEENTLTLEDDMSEATSHIERLSSSLVKMHKACEALVLEKKELQLETQALRCALETEQRAGDLREETIRQKMNYSAGKCVELEDDLKKTRAKLGIVFQRFSEVNPRAAIELNHYL